MKIALNAFEVQEGHQNPIHSQGLWHRNGFPVPARAGLNSDESPLQIDIALPGAWQNFTSSATRMDGEKNDIFEIGRCGMG